MSSRLGGEPSGPPAKTRLPLRPGRAAVGVEGASSVGTPSRVTAARMPKSPSRLWGVSGRSAAHTGREVERLMGIHCRRSANGRQAKKERAASQLLVKVRPLPGEQTLAPRSVNHATHRAALRDALQIVFAPSGKEASGVAVAPVFAPRHGIPRGGHLAGVSHQPYCGRSQMSKWQGRPAGAPGKVTTSLSPSTVAGDGRPPIVTRAGVPPAGRGSRKHNRCGPSPQ